MSVYADGKHDSQILVLNKIGISVVIDNASHSIHLNEGFKREEGYGDSGTQLYNACLDTIESLVMAHAIAGIDVTSPAYQEGLQTTLDALGNNL